MGRNSSCSRCRGIRVVALYTRKFEHAGRLCLDCFSAEIPRAQRVVQLPLASLLEFCSSCGGETELLFVKKAVGKGLRVKRKLLPAARVCRECGTVYVNKYLASVELVPLLRVSPPSKEVPRFLIPVVFEHRVRGRPPIYLILADDGGLATRVRAGEEGLALCLVLRGGEEAERAAEREFSWASATGTSPEPP